MDLSTPSGAQQCSASSTESPTILICDDDAGIRVSLQKRLESAGYQVLAASHGQQAVSVFEDKGADLVILDVNMPGMDGFDICQHLKDIGGDVPVVFLTGNQSDIMRDHMSIMVNAVGGKFFLGKPYDHQLLIRLLDDLLRPNQDKS